MVPIRQPHQRLKARLRHISRLIVLRAEPIQHLLFTGHMPLAAQWKHPMPPSVRLPANLPSTAPGAGAAFCCCHRTSLHMMLTIVRLTDWIMRKVIWADVQVLSHRLSRTSKTFRCRRRLLLPLCIPVLQQVTAAALLPAAGRQRRCCQVSVLVVAEVSARRARVQAVAGGRIEHAVQRLAPGLPPRALHQAQQPRVGLQRPRQPQAAARGRLLKAIRMLLLSQKAGERMREP